MRNAGHEVAGEWVGTDFRRGFLHVMGPALCVGGGGVGWESGRALQLKAAGGWGRSPRLLPAIKKSTSPSALAIRGR
jgi:hypothetical protein